MGLRRSNDELKALVRLQYEGTLKSHLYFWPVLHTYGRLQITVSHQTLAKQNLLMSGRSLSVVRHNAWPLFLQKKKKKKKEKKRCFFNHVCSPLFHSLKVVYVYIFLNDKMFICITLQYFRF